jgi:hypothetical protein
VALAAIGSKATVFDGKKQKNIWPRSLIEPQPHSELCRSLLKAYPVSFSEEEEFVRRPAPSQHIRDEWSAA